MFHVVSNFFKVAIQQLYSQQIKADLNKLCGLLPTFHLLQAFHISFLHTTRNTKLGFNNQLTSWSIIFLVQSTISQLTKKLSMLYGTWMFKKPCLENFIYQKGWIWKKHINTLDFNNAPLTNFATYKDIFRRILHSFHYKLLAK